MPFSRVLQDQDTVDHLSILTGLCNKFTLRINRQIAECFLQQILVFATPISEISISVSSTRLFLEGLVFL